ncbi:hypothetical protein HNQ60_001243 [Povalibacter uvarum]|uniref:DUF2878 domain-containing protein n=1 Tax=Povalibacter uvarum TaxID=732238 RepID=A0A841HHG2_9GAMM|nr:DUF6134 family protein [Povalibacter uvarum]MBB6092397.1 hypothetical protein [Povalibacter uvarum]
MLRTVWNFVAYQIVWFACVLSAARGAAWIGVLAAVIAICTHLVLVRGARVDLLLIGVAAVVGFVTDSVLLLAGCISFAPAAALPGGQPLWMLALWMAFATTLGHSMRWVTQQIWAAALVGAVGGPLAYWGGAKLGALTVIPEWPALTGIGVAWAVSLATLAVAARRWLQPQQAGSTVTDLSRQTPTALAVAFVLAAVLDPSPTHAATREWQFDVFLDDKRIGEHRFEMHQTDSVREIRSDASFDIRFLFINAYRYRHSARELWEGKCLERVDATTDNNGKKLRVTGNRHDSAFVVTSTASGDATSIAATCVQTFAYWNPGFLEADRLLNPQTGEYLTVDVQFVGPEELNGVAANRYRLTGTDKTAPPLQIDLWYSQAGDWLALESLVTEKRRLRYVRR